jgi:hypothetical protein
MDKRNTSGKSLELELQMWLNENVCSYTKSVDGPKSDIDYIVHTKKAEYYIECTNQNIKGSVMDKIPHKVFKYWLRHKMKVIYVLRGSYTKFSKSIYEHLDFISKQCEIEIHIVSLAELKNVLMNKKVKPNKFF